MDTCKVTSVSNVASRFNKHHGNNHIPCPLLIFEMKIFALLPPSRNVAHNIKSMFHVIIVWHDSFPNQVFQDLW